MEKLLPTELMALSCALAQLDRGETPPPNTAAACIFALARVAGREPRSGGTMTDGLLQCCGHCGRELSEGVDADELWCIDHGLQRSDSVLCRADRNLTHDNWRTTRYERQDGSWFEVSVPSWRPRDEYGPLVWDEDAERAMVGRIQVGATGPVLLPPDADANVANELIGESYGVDWEYRA